MSDQQQADNGVAERLAACVVRAIDEANTKAVAAAESGTPAEPVSSEHVIIAAVQTELTAIREDTRLETTDALLAEIYKVREATTYVQATSGGEGVDRAVSKLQEVVSGLQKIAAALGAAGI